MVDHVERPSSGGRVQGNVSDLFAQERICTLLEGIVHVTEPLHDRDERMIETGNNLPIRGHLGHLVNSCVFGLQHVPTVRGSKTLHEFIVHPFFLIWIFFFHLVPFGRERLQWQ